MKRLLDFIRERHSIYLRKSAGEPWPWTADPILQQYRFCNVYRNLDAQSKLIQDAWLAPHKDDKDAWFAMVVARLVNWWPTLMAIGYPVPWRPARFIAAADTRKAEGLKVFTGAYMVRADPHATGSKAAYLAESVLTPIWQGRAALRPRTGDTLQAFHTRLMNYRDMGSFMAAQVVADVKYGSVLSAAVDFETWAASGPGSRRGLNRVLDRAPDAAWTELAWGEAFAALRIAVTPRLTDLPFITGQDLQNCLCEFDKYERVRLGQGRPRSKYQPERNL